MRMLVVFVVLAGACSKRDLTDERYQGMIELEQTDLGFEVPGRIVSIEVGPGAEVKAGQIVARLDDTLDKAQRDVRARELEAAKADLTLVQAGSRIEDVRAARAQLVAAQAVEDLLAREVEKERKLVGTGAAAGSRLDELTGQLARARGERESLQQRVASLSRGARAEEIARAEVRVAQVQAALDLADRQLEKRVLKAPIAASVLDVYPQLGEVVGAGTPVLSLVDRSRPYADVFVPVADAPKIKLGAKISVRVEGEQGEASGVVERMYPHLEFTPRYVYSPRERPNLLMRMRVRLDDREGRLHAGLPAYAKPADVK